MAEPDLPTAKILAGVLGSVVSLRCVKGSLFERASMCIGGAALSYYGSTPTALWVGKPDAEGLIGCLIGLFGMAIMAKGYEVIQATQAGDIVEAIKRKWGA